MPATVEIAVRGTALVYALAEGASVTVGRVTQCEIHVDDQAVSRRHCTLTVCGSELVVTDLESANGTFLNERPVTSEAARPGDLIRVGSTILEYRDPTGPRRPAQAANVGTDADGSMQSVIRKRIEPADVEWLSSATSAQPALDAAAAGAAPPQDAAQGVGGACRRPRSAGACRCGAADDPRRDGRRSSRVRVAAGWRRRWCRRSRRGRGFGIPSRGRSRSAGRSCRTRSPRGFRRSRETPAPTPDSPPVRA